MDAIKAEYDKQYNAVGDSKFELYLIDVDGKTQNLETGKTELDESEGSSIEFSEEYFKKRIPFLKDYKFFDEKGKITAQRIVYHENVNKLLHKEIIKFPQFNAFSEFYYYPHKINENTFHYFGIKNEFVISKPENVDDLTFKVYQMAIKQVNERFSFSDEIMVKEGEEINKEELDKIINKINEMLFKFENLSNENNTSLF